MTRTVLAFGLVVVALIAAVLLWLPEAQWKLVFSLIAGVVGVVMLVHAWRNWSK